MEHHYCVKIAILTFIYLLIKFFWEVKDAGMQIRWVGRAGNEDCVDFFFLGGVVFLFTNVYPIPIFSHVNMCALSSPKPTQQRPDNTFWSHPGSSDSQTKEPTALQELRDSEPIQSPQWHRLTQLHWAATRSPKPPSLSRNRAIGAHALDGWTHKPGTPPSGGTAQLAQCRG